MPWARSHRNISEVNAVVQLLPWDVLSPASRWAIVCVPCQGADMVPCQVLVSSCRQNPQICVLRLGGSHPSNILNCLPWSGRYRPFVSRRNCLDPCRSRRGRTSGHQALSMDQGLDQRFEILPNKPPRSNSPKTNTPNHPSPTNSPSPSLSPLYPRIVGV